MAQLDCGSDLLVVPSVNAAPRTLASIPDLESWTERHLIELRHLLEPGNRVFFITPVALSGACVEAVIRMMPTAPPTWFQHRLREYCLNDRSSQPLSLKLLERPLLLAALRHELRQ